MRERPDKRNNLLSDEKLAELKEVMKAEHANAEARIGEVNICHGLKSAKRYAKQVMRLLREGLADSYTLHAHGTENLKLCDQVMEMIASWVTIISIDVKPGDFISGREKSMSISLRRNIVWNVHFKRHKKTAEMLRQMHEIKKKV